MFPSLNSLFHCPSLKPTQKISDHSLNIFFPCIGAFLVSYPIRVGFSFYPIRPQIQNSHCTESCSRMYFSSALPLLTQICHCDNSVFGYRLILLITIGLFLNVWVGFFLHCFLLTEIKLMFSLCLHQIF